MERKSLKEIYTSPWLNNFFYFFIFSFVLYSLLFAFCSLLSETSGFSLWTEEEEERWIVSKERICLVCLTVPCLLVCVRGFGRAGWPITSSLGRRIPPKQQQQHPTTTQEEDKKKIYGGEKKLVRFIPWKIKFPNWIFHDTLLTK